MGNKKKKKRIDGESTKFARAAQKSTFPTQLRN